MRFSPVSASKDIVEKYTRYLSTVFSLSDPDYQKQFEDRLREMPFANGPFLEVTDAFEKGETIKELIAAGTLPKGFDRIHFHVSRPLYRHQVEALEKVSLGKSIVVSTGTGSGKTESFLMPVMKELVSERNCGKLDAGVRAMLIYPMNALANDQLERLRELLCDFPEITFGSYTGQTKESYKNALDDYRSMNNGESPLKNELISREQMKQTPPHILITNYAMLEYLLVRPDDGTFFEERNTKSWKFIILDEAHVYKGSTGIEVSMLLRRLKARLDKREMTYILTSATLGGEDDNKAAADFASALCDSEFSEYDVVRAKRTEPKKPENCRVPSEGFYHRISELIQNEASDEDIADEIGKETGIYPDDINDALYDIVLNDTFYWEIRRMLSYPRTVSDLIRETGCSEEALTDFVTAATRAVRDGGKLFDARYHMFIRAAECVFVTLAPSKKLFIEGKKTHYEGGRQYKVFEAATCSHCHALYLLGEQSVAGTLEQKGYVPENDVRSAFLVSPAVSDTDDEYTLEDAGEEVEEYDLCAVCGSLTRAGNRHECGHSADCFTRVQKVKLKEDRNILTKCPCCENVSPNGVLRQFFVGHEAVTSVVGTSLFENLPSYSVEHRKTVQEDDSGFDFGCSDEIIKKEAKAKQFIAFSDSRQAAAFYASYLDRSYTGMLYRRAVVEAMKRREYENGKSVAELAEDVSAQFEKYKVVTSGSAKKEAWKAVLHELFDNNGNTSLYKTGLISFAVPETMRVENKKFGLSGQEVYDICALFCDWMLSEGAVSYPEPMNFEDKCFYAPNGIEHEYTLSDADPKKHTFSFIPSREGLSNKRLDYLRKVLRKKEKYTDDEMVIKLLEGLWKLFTNQERGILSASGGAYRILEEKLTVKRGAPMYICKKCKRVTYHNVCGVCTSYRCDGNLEPFCPEEQLADNHYYRLYNQLDIRPLRVVEHTAQLDKEQAYDYQRKFKNKEIDVLSCSTTFEMGVDVGSLETVFMRNVPPSPANYAQRAGRAGRSLRSAAYALTFCNKSSHDFSFFRHPEQMIKGRIDPPVFNTENEKIAIRHVFASAFSFFWRRYPQYFSNVKDFIEPPSDVSGTESGIDRFRRYLSEKPCELREYLETFLPESLYKAFDIANFGWTERLVAPDDGILTRAVDTYRFDIERLMQARDEAYKSNSLNMDSISRRINVYEKEGILAYLARRNVFPKYGFPVDTVEMTIFDRKNSSKIGLELQRDLSIAISEYAPGSQIVANGLLVTSRYIKKLVGRSWKMSRYCICKNCADPNLRPYIPGEQTEYVRCDNCGEQLKASQAGVYLIPEFGFEADGDRITKPGLRKPVRTYNSEISYIGNGNSAEPISVDLGHAEMEIFSGSAEEMLVLNRNGFFVCEKCGYTELDPKRAMQRMKKKHKTSNGRDCGCSSLDRYSLAYRFMTDVIRIRFYEPEITDFAQGMSILYGILEGMSHALSIERGDISGCLRWVFNERTHHAGYELVFYDKTPGGAGHVRRLCNSDELAAVLRETLRLTKNCTCGGSDMDTSCYSCLRNYYNQKYHDILGRKYVVEFIKNIFGK